MTRPRIVFLGTGGAVSVRRHQASLLVQRADPAAAPILLDTGLGMGVVRAMLAADIDPLSIDDVFISHRHPDHAGGLDSLLLWRRILVLKQGRPIADAGLRVHSEPRTLRALRETLAVQASGTPAALGEALEWRPLLDTEPTPIPNGRLVPFLVDHLPVDGGAMGCVLEIDGVRIAYSGDTRPCDRLAEMAQGADVLLHECGGLDENAKQVHRPCHSTAGDAGRMARAAGVKHLILTHISDDEAVPAMKAEAEAAFGGPVTMADDGQSFAV